MGLIILIYFNNSSFYLFVCLLGQQRSRMLATLFKDERCQNLPEFSILEKMYLDRIIRPNEVAQLDAMLQPHQKATTIDGNYTLQNFISVRLILNSERLL